MFRCLVFSLLFATCFSSYEKCSKSSYVPNTPYCYGVVIGHKPASWFQARDDCVQKGGHLADIQSHGGDDLLMELSDHALVGTENVWLGRSVNYFGVWTSETGNNDNWAPGQPELSIELELPKNCVYIRASNWQWYMYTTKCGHLFAKVWVCKFYKK